MAKAGLSSNAAVKNSKRGKKLKIAHVHWAFPPIIGGVETHLAILLPELVKRGHQVSLLTGSVQGPKLHKDYRGINIRREPLMNLNRLSKKGFLGIEKKLRRLIKSFLDTARPDVVHAHNMNYFSKIHARILEDETRKRKIFTVLTAHNSWDDTLFLNLTRKIRWGHIIAVSSYIKKELTSIGCDSNQLTTICHGIDIDKFKPANKKEYKEKFAFLKDKRVILHPARIGIAKGCDISVKAMKIVINKFPDAVLVLTGADNSVDWGANQGNEISYIVDLAEDLGIGDNVFFDMFTLDEMPKLYAISEVCLYPSSNSEPFGLTMLESLASGRPMIVTNSGGMPEIIQDGINGYVIPVRDYEALAARIIMLLEDKTLNKRIGSRGRKFVKSRFTKEVMTDNNMKVYKKVLGLKWSSGENYS